MTQMYHISLLTINVPFREAQRTVLPLLCDTAAGVETQQHWL